MPHKFIRAAAFVIGAALVWYFGKPWPQDNAPFLIGLLIVMWVCGGLFMVFVFDFVADLAGWNKPAVEPWRYTGPVPELSANKQTQVRKIIRALADAGIFAPAAPEPRFAFPGQADFGGKVTVDSVMAALAEAHVYFPDDDHTQWQGNLLMETMEDYRGSQGWIDELEAKLGGQKPGHVLVSSFNDQTLYVSQVPAEQVEALAALPGDTFVPLAPES
jgi:hypothetical protein